MAVDIQRKFRYSVEIRLNAADGDSGTAYTDVIVDEFTPSDVRNEAVSSQNQSLGQVSLTARSTYSEMTLRLALRITEGEVNRTYNLIKSLEDLRDTDYDTCNIILTTKVDVEGTEEVSYKQTFDACRVTGYKLDQLSRKGDDDFLHVDLTLMPSKVSKIIYEFGS